MGFVAGSAPRRAALVLSPLQRQILGVVGGLPEAAPFALAGGAALILRGTMDRGTNDLDFFIGAREMPPGLTIASCVTRSTTGRCRSIIAEVADEAADPDRAQRTLSPAAAPTRRNRHAEEQATTAGDVS